MIERVYYRVKLNTDQIIYSQHIDIAQEMGQYENITMSQKAVTDELNKKFDKAGGHITGDVNIDGNVNISGVVIKVDTETLQVRSNLIMTNSDDGTPVEKSGVVIRVGNGACYGIVHDPDTETVMLGKGEITEADKFEFDSGEGAPVTTRADSNFLVDGHLLKWDATKRRLVDSGYSVSDFEGENTAKLNENIIKDPSKTYLVWKGNQFPNSTNAAFKAPAGCTIDWGDGNVETFDTASAVVNTHTYTDGFEYHLISLSNYTAFSDAFINCRGLISVTIGNSVTSIGINAFNGCSNLTSVTIGNSVTIIGSDAFCACSGLTSVTIPNSVTSIAGSAFYNCSGLTSITIPDSVTSIGIVAFKGCSGLRTIRISATNPPTLNSDAFAETPLEKIIVPKSAINAYKSAAGWSTYADKIVYEVDSSDLGNVEVDNRTITKTSNEEIQAVALTNGTDLLTYAEILQATTIERL